MAYEYQEYPKCLYHPKLAPEGKVFYSAEETQGLARKGWVDTPAKFPKPSRMRVALVAIKQWWSEWEWLFKAVAILLGLIAAAVALLKEFTAAPDRTSGAPSAWRPILIGRALPRSARSLGEHTKEVLREWLSLSDEESDAIKKQEAFV